MCTHRAEDFPGFLTDVQWQHLKRAGDLGQWAMYVSSIHLCGVSSPLLFVCFFFWSIYHKLCKLSQWGDKQPVQTFFWNRQASQEAHCSSGHVYWSTALQQLHCQHSSWYHPAFLWGTLSHSFTFKWLFLLTSRSMKSQGPEVKQYWFTLGNPQVHHQQHQFLPECRRHLKQLQHMLSAPPHKNDTKKSCFMFREFYV